MLHAHPAHKQTRKYMDYKEQIHAISLYNIYILNGVINGDNAVLNWSMLYNELRT